MKKYRWDDAKNKKLQKQRGISFEEIFESLAGGGLLDTLLHPNRRKYKNQKIFIVRHGSYVYMVPFVETEDEIFLKTIIPSRKFFKRHEQGAL